MPRIIIVVICLLFACEGLSQRRQSFHYQPNTEYYPSLFQNKTTPDIKRKRWIAGIGLGSYAGMALYMGTVWYAAEDLAPFKFFDDSHEWKQIDKMGHILGSYNASRWMIGLYKWAGAPKDRAVLTGSLAGFLAMSSIEVFDGFGETWGFSWSDIGANAIGAGLAATNQILWNEDRLQLKVGYLRSSYATNPDFYRLFGSNWAEWVLKDYNGHSFWLSARIHSFLPEGKLKDIYPRWLNIAVGYGAEGLEGGYEDREGPWREREYRQYYLSFDIDLRNIRTRKAWLNSLFEVVSVFRISLPALRYDRTGWAMVPLS